MYRFDPTSKLKMQTYEDQVESLERTLEDENIMLKELKQLVDKNLKESGVLKKSIAKNTRDSNSYSNIYKTFAADEFQRQLSDLDAMKQIIVDRREKLADLNKALARFEGLEPTNEDLQDKVEDLKKSRLSLEMSFLD